MPLWTKAVSKPISATNHHYTFPQIHRPCLPPLLWRHKTLSLSLLLFLSLPSLPCACTHTNMDMQRLFLLIIILISIPTLCLKFTWFLCNIPTHTQHPLIPSHSLESPVQLTATNFDMNTQSNNECWNWPPHKQTYSKQVIPCTWHVRKKKNILLIMIKYSFCASYRQ